MADAHTVVMKYYSNKIGIDEVSTVSVFRNTDAMQVLSR
jgi:hypothetical protein